MSFKKSLMYMGLCLTACTCLAGVQSAVSATGTLVNTVTVLSPDPDISVTVPTWTTLTFLAINAKTTTASATVDATGAVTTIPGTPGNARLVGGDTTGSAMIVDIGSISPGLANGTMNLKISDNTSGAATVDLKSTLDPVANAPFAVNAWTAGTPTNGTIDTFSGTTGLGTITLSATGTFTSNFGATLSTVKDALPKPYVNDDYTGTVNVTVSY